MKDIFDTKTAIFTQAYRSFLSGEGEMSIEQIMMLYRDMKPSLHKKVDSSDVDIEAFMYSFLRLPHIMQKVSKVIMAQTDEIFHREGYKLEYWEEVSAPARRRKMYYDGKGTLAVFINSVTDMDDVVCLLTAFQMEWNKMHSKLKRLESDTGTFDLATVQKTFAIDDDNWVRILRIWNGIVQIWLAEILHNERNFKVQLLRGSYVDYNKATQRWLEYIFENTRYKDLRTKPVYFVSSNTHSLVNNMTGWVVDIEKDLIKYMKGNKMDKFLEYWKLIETGEHPGSRENFLWYILKKYESEFPEVKAKRQHFEYDLGIDTIEAKHYLDINAQVFAVKDIAKSHLGKKLNLDISKLASSEALVINIDYPLGFGAYGVLSRIFQNVNTVKGVYILGKASFLHANLGDIALPDTVFDTYSHNTFIFNNAFTREYFSDFKSGSVLTSQKVVSSQGTFLHPGNVIQQYFINDYSVIEMENGPYLSAVYETTHFERYPENETVNLLASTVDIGIIHYASDTPFTKAVTLGTRNLGYEGVEATYVSSMAILRRIIEMESR
ncbi:hypothetical protein KAZ66_02420 [Candidatus Woesebacteria bacterium]|nr:hypothetical protein [Candidatus Woesebacteria bacterium]